MIPLTRNAENGQIRDRRMKGYQRLGKPGNGQFWFNGYRTFVWSYKNVVEIDNDNMCTTV